MSYLNLASIRLCTESEGPGKRFAIWVQGCNKHCKGCCNLEMQEIKKNKIVQIADLINIISKSKKSNNIEGLTLIGGEPFLQSRGLAEIAQWANSTGLTVLTFTGYLLKELKDMHNSDVDRLLRFTDLLVDGPFIQKLYDNERAWIGSKNQKLWYLSNKYKKGIEYIDAERKMEIMISEGDVLINGWPFI